jgi:hypothetical protein
MSDEQLKEHLEDTDRQSAGAASDGRRRISPLKLCSRESITSPIR